MQGTETWQFIDGDKRISVHPQGRFKADNGAALAAAAVAGLGIAWLPDCLTEDHLTSGALVPGDDTLIRSHGRRIRRPAARTAPRAKSPGPHRAADRAFRIIARAQPSLRGGRRVAALSASGIRTSAMVEAPGLKRLSNGPATRTHAVLRSGNGGVRTPRPRYFVRQALQPASYPRAGSGDRTSPNLRSR